MLTQDSSHSLLRMQDVVKRFAVSEAAIRRATEKKTLRCLRLPSGHRRFREADVLAWMGVNGDAEENSVDGKTPVAAVIRVSSPNQSRAKGSSDKSSLEHQEERLRTYIEDRFEGNARVTWYRSIGSGMVFDRREFLQMMDDILAGKYRGGVIVATDFTRICRFGIKMVEHLCKIGGCSIEYTLDVDGDKSDTEELTDEILSILTHYTARSNGKKAKAILGVHMDESQLRDAYLWYQGGMTYRAIAERLKSEGRGTDSKGRPVSHCVIFRRLKEHWSTLEKLYHQETEPNSFEKFVSERVVKCNPKERLRRKELMAAYNQYCADAEIQAVSNRVTKRTIEELGFAKVFLNGGGVAYKGVALRIEQ